MRLLNEDASLNDVNDAISNMHPAEITYHNDNGNEQATGKRKIFPVAYGISTAGNPVIRAFEDSGDTTSKVPAWKLFLLSNIDSWDTISDESFKDEELNGLAKNGKDKQIQTLYNISPLSKNAVSWINDEPEIGSMPITKDDIRTSGEFNAKDMVDTTISLSDKAKGIDNSYEKEYNNMSSQNKSMNAAPETKPITQNEIPVDPSDENEEENTIEYPSNEPITKDEISGNDNNSTIPNITASYNDMMNRWDKEKEDNENGNI